MDTQDQTVKAAEARELEAELRRMRDENADLRKRLNEVSSLEAAKKKADAKIEQLETKACLTLRNYVLQQLTFDPNTSYIDGRHDSREGHAEGKRAQRDLRRENTQL